MARLTEEMVVARSKQSDLSAIKKLNCWGAELGDVSLLRRMPNVEVLALSINKIRSLSDFAHCPRLRELYVRKNEIGELAEIRHLRGLTRLSSLWLDENPCTEHPEYRLTVLRNLPNLEKLDNVPVQPDELQEAMRRGYSIPDSDDESYAPQESYAEYGRGRSAEGSPARSPERYSCGRPDTAGAEAADDGEPGAPQSGSSPEDERCAHPAGGAALARSHYEAPAAAPAAALRHSFSAQSVKEYAASNGECRAPHAAPAYHEPYYERAEAYQQVPQRCPAEAWERDGASGREYSSAVMAERRGFTRRPVTRNSNLLSAVLCLVKELDYPSLEVAEMAVRCRMDELASGQ